MKPVTVVALCESKSPMVGAIRVHFQQQYGEHTEQLRVIVPQAEADQLEAGSYYQVTFVKNEKPE
jgi:hypothetical protein